ncbi:MAG: hypothetical protein ACFFAN_11455 [Promethearchaeota archaeon]
MQLYSNIRDIKNNKKYPEKLKSRPIASSEPSFPFSFFSLAILIGIIVLSLIFLIPNLNFTTMIFLIILTGQLYNHLLKKSSFIDIFFPSLTYFWRSLAGNFLIELFISPCLFLSIFEIALFLVITKRKVDLMLLKSIDEKNAIEHNANYNRYSILLLNQFHTIIAGALFVIYSFYRILHFNFFSAKNVNFHEYITILTIPLSLYVIMRYIYLTSAKPEIAQNNEKIFLDKNIIIVGICFLGILSLYFYFDKVVELLNL